MKIGHIDTKPVGTAPATERKSAASTAKASSVPASTEVALSAAATGLNDVGTDPTFDSAKVDRIAGAIRNGTFKVNAEAIADKLIVNAEELLGHKFS